MIKKIELRNFKCFERLELPLSNLNLLSGINSMGKSTVIQALLLLRQAYEKDSLREGLYLNGEYTQIGTGLDLLYFNADGDIEIILTNETGQKYRWILDYVPDSDYLKIKKEESEGKDTGILENLNLLNQDFEYVMAERFGPRKSYEKSFYDIEVKKHVGKYGEHVVYYLEKHAGDPTGTETVVLGGKRTLKQQTECWMNEISPGIQFDFTDVQAADTISLKIRQTENAAQMSTIMDYKPVNVGFGISYSLPIIVALLKAKPDDLVILENPEAHLHPQGQRKVGELIARVAQGGVQVIVETHSVHILNGIRLAVKQKVLEKEKVKLYYFCTKAENDITMHTFEEPKLDDNGRLDFWPKGFFDEWDNTLLELL